MVEPDPVDPEFAAGVEAGRAAARRLESRSYQANKRLDDLEDRVASLEQHGRSATGSFLDVERDYARELARAEQQREEALALLEDEGADVYASQGDWRRARDAFLARIKKPRPPS